MSIWLVLGLAWFGLAVLAWACMIAAARGDRIRLQRPPAPRTRPRARPRELV